MNKLLSKHIWPLENGSNMGKPIWSLFVPCVLVLVFFYIFFVFSTFCDLIIDFWSWGHENHCRTNSKFPSVQLQPCPGGFEVAAWLEVYLFRQLCLTFEAGISAFVAVVGSKSRNVTALLSHLLMWCTFCTFQWPAQTMQSQGQRNLNWRSQKVPGAEVQDFWLQFPSQRGLQSFWEQRMGRSHVLMLSSVYGTTLKRTTCKYVVYPSPTMPHLGFL
jgi:hypothetical protein